MGMCAANAEAAYKSGADILDCGLLGMARSAGNMPTELIAALMMREGQCKELDFYGLLHYLDEELIPVMEQNGYHTPLKPKDLILGYSGCHSSFVKKFTAIAEESGVDLYRLIVETSAVNRRNPDEALIRQIAKKLVSEES
jgi:isopropylmalate/homocitrate/citramalate synthase